MRALLTHRRTCIAKARWTSICMAWMRITNKDTATPEYQNCGIGMSGVPFEIILCVTAAG